MADHDLVKRLRETVIYKGDRNRLHEDVCEDMVTEAAARIEELEKPYKAESCVAKPDIVKRLRGVAVYSSFSGDDFAKEECQDTILEAASRIEELEIQVAELESGVQ